MSKPDLTELSKKFNLQGLMDNVKSMINPEGNTPQPLSDDLLGEKMAGLSLLLQESAKVLDEQAKRINEANRLVNDLFKDLNAIRTSSVKAESPAKEELVEKEVATDEGMPEPKTKKEDK